MLSSQRTKEANCYLLFSALTEVQLDLYGNTKNLIPYDPALHNKLHNLRANFERNSTKMHRMFDEEELLQYFRLVNIFESLIKAAHEKEDFSSLLGLIEQFLNKQITVINTHEELVEIAGKSGSGKLEVREEASHA